MSYSLDPCLHITIFEQSSGLSLVTETDSNSAEKMLTVKRNERQMSTANRDSSDSTNPPHSFIDLRGEGEGGREDERFQVCVHAHTYVKVSSQPRVLPPELLTLFIITEYYIT